ncbi:MAG: outer membrane lipoprotein carrier protein LolA [Bacteroidales bacterium]|jgi:outer membrane lipoprotein-sorting protein|nr:outer membrane lipoprotein carrier protein LolA [Bacteroidales bacterium]
MMKILLSRLTLVGYIVMTGGMSVRAQTVSETDNRIVEKIRVANAIHTSVASPFKQTQHLSLLGEDVHSSGRFYYAKPDKLAMLYDDPSGDVMLINGDRFVMVSGSKKKETSAKNNAQMKSMKTILSACLQGDATSIGADKISCGETADAYIIIAEINGKANKSNIVKVTLTFEKTTLTLSVLRTEEKDGSYTTYELTDKKFDQPIDNSIFDPDKKK